MHFLSFSYMDKVFPRFIRNPQIHNRREAEPLRKEKETVDNPEKLYYYGIHKRT